MRVRVGAAAARLQAGSAGPRRAQRGALRAQPRVAQQCARAGAALRVLLEAGAQEVAQVRADALRQARVLVLGDCVTRQAVGLLFDVHGYVGT